MILAAVAHYFAEKHCVFDEDFALRISRIQPPIELIPENTVLFDEILDSRQQRVLDSTGHARQHLLP